MGVLYLCGDDYTSPVAMVSENSGSGYSKWNLFYIGRDYLGSITHIIDKNGVIIEENSYDAWGNLRNPVTHEIDNTQELFLGRGYTGHEHLQQFGLINMNARLYDPALGRFLSPDPYIQDPTNTQNFNRYSYVLNNPLKYTDPSGEVYYEWDYVRGCYVDVFGNRVDYSEVHKAMFQNGYFRDITSDGTYYGRMSMWYPYVVTNTFTSLRGYTFVSTTTTTMESSWAVFDDGVNLRAVKTYFPVVTVTSMKVMIPSGVRYDQIYGQQVLGQNSFTAFFMGIAKITGQAIKGIGFWWFDLWKYGSSNKTNPAPTPVVAPVPVVPEPMSVIDIPVLVEESFYADGYGWHGRIELRPDTTVPTRVADSIAPTRAKPVVSPLTGEILMTESESRNATRVRPVK